jgi:NADH-quinone oxidoreductase subunit N
VDPNVVKALTGFVLQLLPEAVLGVLACVLFLGATWKNSRALWGGVSLVGLALAGLALWYTATQVPTADANRARLEEMRRTPQSPESSVAEREQLRKDRDDLERQQRAVLASAPVVHTRLGLLIKLIAIVGAVILVLASWGEVPDSQAAEYNACLLLMTGGVCLVGVANDLITLFLALELVSIPTYVMLYLPRIDAPAQEAAMKYFLLSVFSSGLMLFGFSYLYGVTGTTNIPGILEALSEPVTAARPDLPWRGLALVAVVLVIAGLGAKITAVPFHFYAPDVYQGTATPVAAVLAFVPKVAGFVALVILLGYLPQVRLLEQQLPVLLWILAAVTMSLGNVLALLQDNVKRLLAYSSVSHAGYMLIGLAMAPKLFPPLGAGAPLGGVEAVLFYLVAYGAMTIGAFAVLSYLSTPERRVETADDLAGLGRSHPGTALLMTLFLFSLIGMPLTAGFLGKLLLFLGAVSVPDMPDAQPPDQSHRLFVWLTVIAAVNAAIGGWYYLRLIAVMYLRDSLRPVEKPRASPVLVAMWLCAVVTLGVGVYPGPVMETIKSVVRTAPQAPPAVAAQGPADRAVAAGGP